MVRTTRTRLLPALLIISIMLASLPFSITIAAQTSTYEAVHAEAVIEFQWPRLYSHIVATLPRYITVGRNVNAELVFTRSACLNGVWVTVALVGTIKTSTGTESITLGFATFSFDCHAKPVQRASVSILVPEKIYRESIDKKMSVDIKLAAYSSGVGAVCVTESVGASVVLVKSVPVVSAVIEGVSGATNLSVGGKAAIAVAVRSVYAPIIVESVKVSVPSFVSAYVDTPMPLNIGANQSRDIVIVFKGLRPGAGVASITISYYSEGGERSLTLYVPILVEGSKIFNLISEYRKSIEQLRNEVRSLEAELGLKLSASQSLAPELDRVLSSLRSLEEKYSQALKELSTVAGLRPLIAQSSREIAYLRSNVSALNRCFNALSKKVVELNASVHSALGSIESEIKSVAERVNTNARAIERLEKSVQALSRASAQVSTELHSINAAIKKLESESRRLSTLFTVLIAMAIASIAVATTAIAIARSR